MTRRAVLAAAVLTLAAPAAVGQPATVLEPANLRGESAQTRKRLAEARQKIATNPAAAVEELQRVLDDAGDDLIPVDDPGSGGVHRQFRPARWVAHRLLSGLPPDALAAYQDRIDEPARKLLEAGRRDRDERPLWQLLDRYFVSRPARDGLLLLGDLLFERGRFRTAELLWRRLLLPTADRPWGRLLAGDADLPHPSPHPDPAAVRARVVLAINYQGERERAADELVRFAALHPTARGRLAGTDGRYTDTLAAVLATPSYAATGMCHDWPTFGGGPDRSGHVHERLPRLWPEYPTWRANLRTGGVTQPAFNSLAAPPFGHPVVQKGSVYLADETRLAAFDLHTGTPLGFPFHAESRPRPDVSLTAAEGRLFARQLTALTCYAPVPDAGSRGAPVREVWRISPPGHDGTAATWDGPPLVAGGRMWAVVTRTEGGRVVHAVAGYDPLDPDAAPARPSWVTDVSDALVPVGAPAAADPLTLAGRHVVLGTNTGAVVAVNARDGRRSWGFRYARAKGGSAAWQPPAPTPAVAAGGRVFVAPADADRVYALEEETGRLLWESEPAHGARILGVTRNRVVVSTTGPVRGIRGLAVANGSYRPEDGGWVQADGGVPLGYGSGLVSDNLVVWPTRAGLHFLDPDTGRPLGRIRGPLPPPHDGQFGNLAYADGVLVVVTPTELWGYVALDRAPDAAPPGDPDRRRFDKLIGRAEDLLERGDPAQARAELTTVVRSDLPLGMRGWAAARMILLAPTAEGHTPVPPELDGQWVVTPTGAIRTVGELAEARSGRKPPAGSMPDAGEVEQTPTPTVLGKTVTVAKTIRLPPAGCPLLPLNGTTASTPHVFAVAGPDLLAISHDGTTVTSHPSPGTVTHAADIPGGFVVAGPGVVAVYAAGRDPVWTFRVPDPGPLPDHPGKLPVRIGAGTGEDTLSAFALAGSWLFARLGGHHLLALDLATQHVAWVLGSNGGPQYEPVVWPGRPRFEPRSGVVAGRLLVQLSDGRRWFIDAASGRVTGCDGEEIEGPVPPGYGAPTAPTPWASAPTLIGRHRIAVADGPGLVRLIDTESGEATVGYAADGPSSLSGESPQIRAFNGTALVAVHRSHGVELDRLASAPWHDGPACIDAARIDLAHASADADRVYLPVENRACAVAWRDGHVAWDVELPSAPPGSSWAVHQGRGALIVHPCQPIPRITRQSVMQHTLHEFAMRPAGGRLPGLAATAYDAWVDRTIPVLVLDPKTGAVLDRLDLPARGPVLVARFDGSTAVIACGDRVTWLK